jgi:lipopolysaccharide/colanic/teichoic acid biosynthesis glycosyltransferase/ribosomal protein S18 acetylase RimI-like enzyme
MVLRFLDILLSGVALLVFAPLLVPIVILLRLTGEGEVFFGQDRVGRGGRHFKLLKFATMLKNSPNMGTGTVTLRNDPRVLPVGRFLRKIKINELPQLLNILMGDMSVIGPRPQTQRCFDAFPKDAQRAILTVRPGLSGTGSIVFRNEEEMMHAANDPDRFYDHVIMPYKGRLEEWYVRNQGVTTYVLLILLTLWVIVRPQSGILWRVFPDLPKPPADLIQHMNGPARPALHDIGTIRQVAALHAACIDQGFLATLGPRFLTVLYRAIDACPAAILIVEKSGDRVTGFVAGGGGMSPVYRQMIRLWPALIPALLPVLFQPRKVLGIIEILRRRDGGAQNADLPRHELFRIAVAPEARGSGTADRLYRALCDHFRENAVPAFRIVVGDALIPAHRFYKRMGATPTGSVHLHGDASSTVYVQTVETTSRQRSGTQD